MDPSMYLYKAKVKEAVELFSSMPRENQPEAVHFLSDTCNQLGNMVSQESDYAQAILCQNQNQSEDMKIAESSEPLVTSFTDCLETAAMHPIYCDTSASDTMPFVPMTDPVLNTPPISASELDYFHGGNFMDNSFEGDSFMTDNEGKNLGLLDDPELEEVCLSLLPPSNSASCAIAQAEIPHSTLTELTPLSTSLRISSPEATDTSYNDEPADFYNDTIQHHESLPRASNTISDNDEEHTCATCGKSGFSNKYNLKRHQLAHSGSKPFKCDVCGACFTEKKSLKIHARRHTGEKPYKCDICNMQFIQIAVLHSHMARHNDERKFRCNECGRTFRQKTQLVMHLKRHEGVKLFECSTCMAKFLTRADLLRHHRMHTGEKPFTCNICGKTYTRRQNLADHIRTAHERQKPRDRDSCEQTFSEEI